MVEVIGKSDKSKTVTCRNCGSILGYWPIDRLETRSQITSDALFITRHIICPTCQWKVLVR